MGQQNRQVNGPEPRWVSEHGRAPMQVISQVSVISEITNQKKSRGDKGGDHAVAVRLLVLAANEIVTCAEEHGAQPIQTAINYGKVGWAHGSCSNRFTAAS